MIGIFQLFVVLVVVGVVLWALNTFVPMDARIKQLINVLVGVFIFLWFVYFLFSFISGGFPDLTPRG